MNLGKNWQNIDIDTDYGKEINKSNDIHNMNILL